MFSEGGEIPVLHHMLKVLHDFVYLLELLECRDVLLISVQDTFQMLLVDDTYASVEASVIRASGFVSSG
jgi:hypothetical protein